MSKNMYDEVLNERKERVVDAPRMAKGQASYK